MKYTIDSVNAAIQDVLRENPVLASNGITRKNYHEIATHIYGPPQVMWREIYALSTKHLTAVEIDAFASIMQELPEYKESKHCNTLDASDGWTQMAVSVVLTWQSHAATMSALRAFMFERFCVLLETDTEFQEIDRCPAPDPNCREVHFRSRGHNFSVRWRLYPDDDDYDEITLWACNKDGPVFYTDACTLADITDPIRLLKTWISESIHDNIPGV